MLWHPEISSLCLNDWEETWESPFQKNESVPIMFTLPYDTVSDNLSIALVAHHSSRFSFANGFFQYHRAHYHRSASTSPFRRLRSPISGRRYWPLKIHGFKFFSPFSGFSPSSDRDSGARFNAEWLPSTPGDDSGNKYGNYGQLDEIIIKDSGIIEQKQLPSTQCFPGSVKQIQRPSNSNYWSNDALGRLLKEMRPDCETLQSGNPPMALTAFQHGSMKGIPGAYELNVSFRANYLKLHRHILAPDEAFGAIFTWDVVAANARELECLCWDRVAKERGLTKPDLDDILRAELMAPEAAVSRVFYWTTDWSEIKRVVFRKQELFSELQRNFVWDLPEGLGQFLNSLLQYGIKCILCAKHPNGIIVPALKAIGLDSVFTNTEIVSSDDDCDTLEQMLLTAAMKCERPPEKCVVFTDNLAGITAAHEISSKAVALIGPYPAYEIKTADHVVGSFNDLVVYNVRRLFSGEEMEIPDPQVEH